MKRIIPIVIALVVIIFIVVLVKNMIQVKNDSQPAATSTYQSNTNTNRGGTTSGDTYNSNTNTGTVANGNTNTYIPPTTTGGTTSAGTTTTGSTTTNGTTGGTTSGTTTVSDPLDQKGLVNIDGELKQLSHTLFPFSKNNPKADVINLQKFLKAKGYLSATAKTDGSYGNMTKAAVIKYQKANGILATGNVGPITLKAINTGIELGQKGLVN